jgi:outer membrane protein
MNTVKKFITILIVLFLSVNTIHAEDQIVYLNLENVISNTKTGKLILDKLEKSKKKALLEFEKKEKDLRKIEDEIKKQKNIISEDELKKRLVEFRKELSNFRQARQKVIKDFNQKKKFEFEQFFKKITPIIEKYVSEQNIDMVLDRKKIFIASKKKDITKDIIQLIDSKLK